MKLPFWLSGKSDAQLAIDEYNLGLAAKYRGEWKASLAHNQRAALLNDQDQATWWNLGIAATALRDWPEARRAWRKCGIDDLGVGEGEILWEKCTACVRLDPNGVAEVVWGDRIDPARIKVRNVPLASSGRRYGDILINDGAAEGTRLSGGVEYYVFDELGLWQCSEHSTYEAEIVMPNAPGLEALEERCRENDLWVEDWGTVRSLCAACSRGNPGEHACTSVETRESRFGFASKSEAALRKLLREWVEVEDGATVNGLRLVVSGVTG